MLHKAQQRHLTFVSDAGINQVSEQVVGNAVSNVVEQISEDTLSGQDSFRSRMESQCHQIKLYRLAVLREGGRLLSSDEAALEWIERYAATFD